MLFRSAGQGQSFALPGSAGALSLIAGIVVTVTPVTSVTVLAVLLGIWFIVIGFFEIIAGIMLRRAVSTAPRPVRPEGLSGTAV